MTDAVPLNLFNSPLETGVRSVVLLETAYPRGFDLTQLTWLDHLVVHTADIDGPESLHPNIPQRNGELLVRRSLVEEGLTLMRRMHLIEAKFTADGIIYIAGEQAAPFVGLIRTDYGRTLKERASWLLGYVGERGLEHLHEVIATKIGRWTIEFQSDAKPAGGS
ncbi:ABC-three component system middle component 2 [Vineibacter terrae]|uniref:ABC-three component system middle component 2 n=1 Tax=Vineibacter terrae TaxID=2586908 RepID=UPI002E316C71|nr:ABC-three component system middle component 2 [Vineibacter terrae]HEX2886236.1 ABC-three component system middle component 2 [Vineibacter terrae]